MTEDNKKPKQKKEKNDFADETDMGSCPECGSRNVEVMTRVTGFFSKVNSWNKGKIGELKKRRTAIRANIGALTKDEKNEAEEDVKE